MYTFSANFPNATTGAFPFVLRKTEELKSEKHIQVVDEEWDSQSFRRENMHTAQYDPGLASPPLKRARNPESGLIYTHVHAYTVTLL